MRVRLFVTSLAMISAALLSAALLAGCGAGEEEPPSLQRKGGPPHLRGEGRLISVADPPWPRHGATYGLQEGLCELEPGDVLEVLRGKFTGPIRIGDECNDGTADKPIKVVGPLILHGVASDAPVLELRRAHWVLEDVEVLMGAGQTGPGFLISGPGAHDIEIVHMHVHNGDGAGIRIEDGSARIEFTRSLVHHVRDGLVVDSGARDIRIIDSKILNAERELTAMRDPAAKSSVTFENTELATKPFADPNHPAAQAKLRRMQRGEPSEPDEGGE